VATGRKRDHCRNGSNAAIDNLWQPTATSRALMVRRGSTVRVRQRALQKRRKPALFFLTKECASEPWASMESVMEKPAFRALHGLVRQVWSPLWSLLAREVLASAPISRSGDATRTTRAPTAATTTNTGHTSPPRTSTQRPCADATERDCSSTTARPARRTHPRIRGRLSLRTRRVPVAGHVVAGRLCVNSTNARASSVPARGVRAG
jgi:hypothetical protein